MAGGMNGNGVSGAAGEGATGAAGTGNGNGNSSPVRRPSDWSLLNFLKQPTSNSQQVPTNESAPHVGGGAVGDRTSAHHHHQHHHQNLHHTHEENSVSSPLRQQRLSGLSEVVQGFIASPIADGRSATVAPVKNEPLAPLDDDHLSNASSNASNSELPAGQGVSLSSGINAGSSSSSYVKQEPYPSENSASPPGIKSEHKDDGADRLSLSSPAKSPELQHHVGNYSLHHRQQQHLFNDSVEQVDVICALQEAKEFSLIKPISSMSDSDSDDAEIPSMVGGDLEQQHRVNLHHVNTHMSHQPDGEPVAAGNGVVLASATANAVKKKKWKRKLIAGTGNERETRDSSTSSSEDERYGAARRSRSQSFEKEKTHLKPRGRVRKGHSGNTHGSGGGGGGGTTSAASSARYSDADSITSGGGHRSSKTSSHGSTPTKKGSASSAINSLPYAHGDTGAAGIMSPPISIPSVDGIVLSKKANSRKPRSSKILSSETVLSTESSSSSSGSSAEEDGVASSGESADSNSGHDRSTPAPADPVVPVTKTKKHKSKKKLDKMAPADVLTSNISAGKGNGSITNDVSMKNRPINGSGSSRSNNNYHLHNLSSDSNDE